MSDWFDGYVKKAESADCAYPETNPPEDSCDERENLGDQKTLQNADRVKGKSNENLVLLFKSNTHLDLTKEGSDYTLSGKKSERSLRKDVSAETFETNGELDSIDLSYRRSYFSLKKSSSDICVGSIQSDVGLSRKNTLVSIYRNQDGEKDGDSMAENRRLFSSLPNVHLKDLTFKEGGRNEEKTVAATKTKIFNQRDLLRRKILEIAAKEFVEDCNKAKEVPVEAPVVDFLEEEYTVPKKRRKVDGIATKAKSQKIFRFAGVQNFDLNKFKELTISNSTHILKYRKRSPSRTPTNGDSLDTMSNPDSTRSDGTLCGASSATSACNDYSPRIFAILDNVLSRENRDDKKLVVMTSDDCRRLIELDREKLPDLQRRLRKMKKRQVARRRSGTLKLPAIEDKRRIVREDKEIQVSEALHLPRIVDKKLRRRNNGRKLDVDIRKGIDDVYLEYDSERWVLKDSDSR